MLLSLQDFAGGVPIGRERGEFRVTIPLLTAAALRQSIRP